MPLIPCPACEHRVSDQAVSCPQCGHPLRPTTAEPPAPPAAVPAPESAPEAAAEAAAATEPADPLRCICGTWNRVGDVRCLSCRRPLGQTVTGRRPVTYVNTAPLVATSRDPERERRERADEAAETLGTISVICAFVGFLLWPLIFGLLALAFGIPAYLRGSQRGLTGIIAALVMMGLTLLFLAI